MKKMCFVLSFFLTCNLFAVHTPYPLPNLEFILPKKILTQLTPNPEHTIFNENAELYYQDILNSVPDSKCKADFSKSIFVSLLQKVLEKSSKLDDALKISYQEIRGSLSETECELWDKCAELYYKEKPKNSLEIGYRLSEEFAKHYKNACIKTGMNPEPFSSRQLFFEILVDAMNTLLADHNEVAAGWGFGGYYRSDEQEQKMAEAEARRAEAEARRAEAERERVIAERDLERERAEREKTMK